MADNTRLNTDGNQLNPPEEFYNNQCEPGYVVDANAGNNEAGPKNQPTFDLMEELVTENEKLREENLRLEQKLVESKIQNNNLKSENMRLKIKAANVATNKQLIKKKLLFKL